MAKVKDTPAPKISNEVSGNPFVEALHRAINHFFSARGMGLPDDAHWDVRVRNFSATQAEHLRVETLDSKDDGRYVPTAPAYCFTIELTGIPSPLARVQEVPIKTKKVKKKKKPLTLEQRIKKKVKETYRGELAEEG